MVVVVLLVAFLVPTGAQAAQPVVWVFGTSIPAGVGASAGHSWPDRYAQLTGSKVRMFAVGGSAFDAPGNVISTQVRAALAQYPTEKPSLVLVDGGTNDLVSHNDLYPVFMAVIGVDLLLQTRGVHGTYLTILPMGYGSSHPDLWVAPLTERAQQYNEWLRGMASGGAFGIADMSGVLHEGNDGIITAPWLLPDGLHPSNDAALLVAARLGAQFG